LIEFEGICCFEDDIWNTADLFPDEDVTGKVELTLSYCEISDVCLGEDT
jgi:hypothetical protein